jgi:hypothetical protein
MPDYLAAALYFQGCAEREQRAAERGAPSHHCPRVSLAGARGSQALIRDIPKRPAAPSVRRDAMRRRRA